MLCACLQAAAASVSCKQQIVTTLTVVSNGGLATQSLNYAVPCIGRYSAYFQAAPCSVSQQTP